MCPHDAVSVAGGPGSPVAGAGKSLDDVQPVGVVAWGTTVLVTRFSAGAFTAAVTDTATYLPYLAVAACAIAVIGYASRTPRRI